MLSFKKNCTIVDYKKKPNLKKNNKMKKMKLYTVVGFITIAGSAIKAQVTIGNSSNVGTPSPMVALNSGDIESLDKVKKVNIIYDYSELGVGAFRKEEDYLNKRKEDFEKKKKPEDFEKFKTNWVNSRKERYEPKFEVLFNKEGGKVIDMTGTNYATSNAYTLLVRTVFIEPGVNIGIMKKPSYIDLEFVFKDKEGKELCVFYAKNMIGVQAAGFDYDMGSRLVESYAKSAKMLVGAIKKERKKAAKKKK